MVIKVLPSRFNAQHVTHPCKLFQFNVHYFNSIEYRTWQEIGPTLQPIIDPQTPNTYNYVMVMPRHGHQLQMIMCLLPNQSRSRHDFCHEPLQPSIAILAIFLHRTRSIINHCRERKRERDRFTTFELCLLAPQWCHIQRSGRMKSGSSGIVVASARLNRLTGFIGVKGVEKSPGSRTGSCLSFPINDTVFLFDICHSNISCATAKMFNLHWTLLFQQSEV